MKHFCNIVHLNMIQVLDLCFIAFNCNLKYGKPSLVCKKNKQTLKPKRDRKNFRIGQINSKVHS